MFTLMVLEGSVLSTEYAVIKNPVLMLFGVFYYIWFVGITYTLRNYIRNDLFNKKMLLTHNLISIGSSAYIFFGILYEVCTRGYTLVGNELDVSHTALTHYIWAFHMTKYYEYMDTIVMILRGSFRQITFLHVYHHASVVVYTWMVLYSHPGGDYYLGPLINSWVHMWMYMYYLLSGIITDKQVRKRYLWWSVYLTRMQIAQFFVNLGHSIYAIMYSPCRTSLYTYGLMHQISFIWLFGNFYYRKYKTKKCGGSVDEIDCIKTEHKE